MDWRRLAKALILEDGHINERETLILKRVILADRSVDKEEMEFLVELRRSAMSAHPEFERLYFDALKRVVLTDGVVRDEEARWLRTTVFADQPLDAAEQQFLRQLKREAELVGDEFNALCQAAGPSTGPASRP
jgi:hypothetical protein